MDKKKLKINEWPRHGIQALWALLTNSHLSGFVTGKIYTGKLKNVCVPALVGNPQFLILDEPLNGLDPEGIKDVRAIIAKLNEEYGVTIMISSHILSELQKVANHYGFLKNGVLIQEFSSSEIADTDLETFYFKNFL